MGGSGGGGVDCLSFITTPVVTAAPGGGQRGPGPGPGSWTAAIERPLAVWLGLEGGGGPQEAEQRADLKLYLGIFSTLFPHYFDSRVTNEDHLFVFSIEQERFGHCGIFVAAV